MGAWISSDDTLIFESQDSGKLINTSSEVQLAFPNLLDYCEQVREVHLAGNSYSQDACQAIAQHLLKFHNISVANLSDIFQTRD